MNTKDLTRELRMCADFYEKHKVFDIAPLLRRAADHMDFLEFQLQHMERSRNIDERTTSTL